MFLGDAVLPSKLSSSGFDKDLPPHPLFDAIISEPGNILAPNKAVVELVDNDSPIVASFVKVQIEFRNVVANFFAKENLVVVENVNQNCPII